jgi:hypothetical protein
MRGGTKVCAYGLVDRKGVCFYHGKRGDRMEEGGWGVTWCSQWMHV